MFTWVKQKIGEFRFERSFHRYESELRAKNILEAKGRFGAIELRKEIDALSKKIELEADQRFSDEMFTINSTIEQVDRELLRLEAQLTLLKRDFRTELASLYDELNMIKEQLSDLFEAKQEAFDRKDQAKTNIQNWYNKSERSFFGNKGKMLPRHSMFGQSFGDLEYYKSERDDASIEIVSCAEEIQELKARKKKLVLEIGDAKRHRASMHALRSTGVTRHRISEAISTLQQAITRHRTDKAVLENERVSFVEAGRHRYGVVAREEKVRALDEQKANFISAFEHKIAHLRRRTRFRQTIASQSMTN